MKEGWTYKKLGEVATFSRGLTYSKKDVSEDTSKKVLRSNNIDLATNSLNYEDIAYLKEDFVIPEDKILHKNDIFICMSNGSTKHLGKVAFIETETDYAFGGFMGAIHPKTSEVFPKFAFYFCLSSEYRRCLATVLNGININNIKWSDLSKFSIPIPPLAEQERIVAELDLLSSIIDKKKAQLKAYDQLAQSIFYSMFGDPITNEKAWEVKKMGEIGTIVGGSTPSTNDQSNWDGTINWITPAELGEQLYYGETIRKLTEKGAKGLTMMPVGTVLLSSRAPIGKLAITTTSMCCNQGFKNIICNNNINNVFLYYYLKNTMNLIQALGRGATFKEVSKSAISSYKVIIPPLALQQEFAEKVEAIERQKSLIQQSIVETQTLFDSRMDYWFG